MILSISETNLNKALDSILKLGAMNKYRGGSQDVLEAARAILLGRGRK